MLSCLGLSEAPIGLCKLQGGGEAEAPEAPLPSATLPPNRPPLGPGRSGEPLGVVADPSLPRIQFPCVACWGPPYIGICLSQGGGSEVEAPEAPLPSAILPPHRAPTACYVAKEGCIGGEPLPGWGGSKVLSWPG